VCMCVFALASAHTDTHTSPRLLVRACACMYGCVCIFGVWVSWCVLGDVSGCEWKGGWMGG